jgi:hypothetical protein
MVRSYVHILQKEGKQSFRAPKEKADHETRDVNSSQNSEDGRNWFFQLP